MRTCLLVLVATLLCPSVARAQASTADGIRALVAGDTVTAMRILTPLAAGPKPDPVAQFFLGALAEATGDLVRACGLYSNSAQSPSPFSAQAAALANAMRQSGTAAMLMFCDRAKDGVWGEPEPISLELGPGHRVATDVSGFSVVYRETERKTRDRFGGPGRIYLPTRYTRMTIAEPTRTRHFIEYWYWEPDDVRTPATWTLVWVVYEVVGADVKQVAMSGAGTVSASRPPADFRLDSAGRLQINTAGEVERVVLRPEARTDVIPSGGTR